MIPAARDAQNGHGFLRQAQPVVFLGGVPLFHVDDHVWLGQSVTLLKDTHIPRDCVVGAHSLVGKKDFFPNSIIAGIPAKAIKSGITWDEKRIHDYISKKQSGKE